MPDISTITSLDDLENTVWDMSNHIFQLCDEAEAQEPLQAKQTIAILKEQVAAMEAFINTIPEKEEGTPIKLPTPKSIIADAIRKQGRR